ncbi:MAG TPA: extensin family protein [Polyangiaceae bacterium]|nr:extensin family protein [Polyangiaceae bacterium]
MSAAYSDRPLPALSPQADLDPDNDLEVGPPNAVPDCEPRLEAAGVTYSRAEIPLHRGRQGIATCGANDAVIYRTGPTGAQLRPPALVTCRLALALADLEQLTQELASRHFGSRVRTINQGGTFNCRKMARFRLVSEHSFGNAIDVRSFTLSDGRTISVQRDFGTLGKPPLNNRSKFLRELGEQAFDRAIVSVSLGPYWDALHRDHFHFDMARYRVDGSRPGSTR